MLKELENSNGVTCGQRDPLVACHDLLCGRQCSAHDESCEIQSLVCGGGSEKAFLFARRSQFDPIITHSGTYWHILKAFPPSE